MIDETCQGCGAAMRSIPHYGRMIYECESVVLPYITERGTVFTLSRSTRCRQSDWQEESDLATA